jgi:hypothetical protein
VHVVAERPEQTVFGAQLCLRRLHNSKQKGRGNGCNIG